MSGEDDGEAEGPRGERIAKFLARAGVASRRDAEKLIAEGLVRLGGKLVAGPRFLPICRRACRAWFRSGGLI